MSVSNALDKGSIRNILIRATNWLGDAVMTTPAIGAIRESFPGARLTLLANPLVAELFSPHAWVDDVLIYDRKGRHAGIKGRLAMASELKRHGSTWPFYSRTPSMQLCWPGLPVFRTGWGTVPMAVACCLPTASPDHPGKTAAPCGLLSGHGRGVWYNDCRQKALPDGDSR